MGIRGSPTAELAFDRRPGPGGATGSARRATGSAIAMRTFDRSRPGIAAQAVGIAQGALEVGDGLRAGSGGSSASGSATSRWSAAMLADMDAATEAARQLLYKACAEIEAGSPDAGRWSAMCKLVAGDAAMRVTTDAVQVLGGYGYIDEFPVERMMRDAKITQIYEGTQQIQRLVIARALLGKGRLTGREDPDFVRIVVLVKPVPDPASGGERLGPDGRLDRAATPAVVNGNDEYALEAALKLVDRRRRGERGHAPLDGAERRARHAAQGARDGRDPRRPRHRSRRSPAPAPSRRRRCSPRRSDELEFDLVLAGVDTSDGVGGTCRRPSPRTSGCRSCPTRRAIEPDEAAGPSASGGSARPATTCSRRRCRR